jgi:uncharacterized protein YcbX
MHLASLYRYPVKGLTPEPLQRASLTAGETLAFDRAWAIENGAGRFDPAAPRHLPKINFLMLMRDERLATLRSTFDDATETLAILRDGKQVARGQLTTPLGRQLIEQFFAAKCVHIVNLASVRELERTLGRPVDPLRFRANLYLEGVEPWAELGWMGKEMAVGDARLAVFKRTQRCEATNVDPERGVRDIAIPAHLQRTWGHQDFGIYARVTSGAEIAIGTPVIAPV